ncbi:phage tail protein [Ruegeria sp. HKCCD7318]|uniref:phage tail protein n=1 Tax=Ruegeria sp. HKCCD7318 TaxID=2683014 RepID=UPI001490CA12|nr:hypothetical protein [Ruegeria sp. HKCCD7318]NOE36246.1 hypothetical protein [Ruegeria sp. HKCCD7318]
MADWKSVIFGGIVGAVIPVVGATWYLSGLYTSFQAHLEHESHLERETETPPTVEELKVAILSDPAALAALKGQDGVDGEPGRDGLNGSEFPSGAVVAFDFSPTMPQACPEGWGTHRELRGRFIVGAGSPHSNKDSDGEQLADYEIGETGGTEVHTLLHEEMPKHSHEFPAGISQGQVKDDSTTHWFDRGAKSTDRDIQSENVLVSKEGQGLAHNNMPPYIALYFCKKM